MTGKGLNDGTATFDKANDKSKVTVAQDLYDIYTTQSYTCTVEMMGCAWVQPMMYFVLLNVPMFRGTYQIIKVSYYHNIIILYISSMNITHYKVK